MRTDQPELRRTLSLRRLAVALAAFVALTAMAPLPITQRWNRDFSTWLHSAAPIPSRPVGNFVRLGNGEVVISAVALAGFLLIPTSPRSGVTTLLLAGWLIVASVIALALKYLIASPGPAAGWAGDTTILGLRLHELYSFPSGHTLRITLLAGTTLRKVPWLAGALVISMMASLVYLRHHWLSDVLGGLCLGWVLVEAATLTRFSARRGDPGRLEKPR